jgi:small subunit ribosomal protein S17
MARTIVGRVVSAKSQNTITVKVDRRITHPVYKKQYTKSNKFHVHDANSEANVGDLVEAIESRPISKTKSWVLNKVVEKAQGVGEVL